ncbi:MAG: hypothetical protein EBQ62_02460 [Alphaproteobacteria bacterium]|jgi:hypothetical protein|nr:hypothetical protein [Rickettsiaceae bacterium]NBY35148.1 hypothetical protein [Alphaproteobacteria bacterium]UCM94505.1 MAG: hypothetical protein LF888_02190 [Candidatus Megaira endosymbiont of Mesostigma viride]HJK85524.1 hypothetical protein [Candidatus Megaera endosymbiont of Stentor roeselii]HJK87880.1 hypothetical protein [Candidatus Megaira endosymbiont of Mesostigma viride]
MSLDFIHTFQLKILNNLETLVREHVNQVYISVIEDGNYPFISINLVKLENYSKALQFIYLLEFEICIFSKDKNKKSLINISKLVEQLLLPDNLKIPSYIVAGIKLNQLVFSEARDLVHNKLTMLYKTMIKKELIE